MNIKTLVAALAVTLMAASPALAASFSFNKASAGDMVAGAKEEGVTLPQAVADAIVKYRTDNGPFASSADLAKVPGMTPELIKALAPEKSGSDLVSKGEEEEEPGMKAY